VYKRQILSLPMAISTIFSMLLK